MAASRTARPRQTTALATGLVIALACSLAVLGVGPSQGATHSTGFKQPFLGARRYVALAPVQIAGPRQLHRRLGKVAAHRIALAIGLHPRDAFSRRQYQEFIHGRGHGARPVPTRVIDASVKILTNTRGRPLYADVNGHLTPTVLASYGLFVNHRGRLESLANKRAPTRQANNFIKPTGYLTQWCEQNHARHTLVALYRSAYTIEVAYGLVSQRTSDLAQLVPNNLRGVSTEVGMSMAPTIWLTNFALLYVLHPALAAKLPNRWAPVPPDVAAAMHASSTGQVSYAKYASELVNG
jgi:hypothetical protein